MALRASHPVFSAAGHDPYCVYIWDEAYLKASKIGFNRLAFVLEALGMMGVDVIEGPMIETLRAIRTEMNLDPVYVAATQCPVMAPYIEAARLAFPVTVVPDHWFSPIAVPKDADRFFSYWKQVKPVIYNRIWRNQS